MLRHILGLDDCHLSDEEIMKEIHRAQQKHLSHVDFRVEGHVVRINVNEIAPQGMMKGYQPYYGG